MIFKIKKKSKEVLETVISITEMTKEVTVAQLLYDERENKKNLTEVEAMVKFEKAKITNIKNNHPDVQKLSKKMLIAAFLYYQATTAVKEGNDKISQLNEALKNLVKHKKDIKKQTGFDFEQFKPKPQPKPIVPKK